MYAGHDGNVYKNTGSGWQKYDNGSWNSVNTPSQQRAAGQGATAQSAGAAQRSSMQRGGGQMQSLQNEAMNRQRGAQSSSRFPQGSFGGGGRSFGGGGGRSFGGGGRRR